MLLYAKQLLEASLDTFNRLKDDSELKCKLDIITISRFSGALHSELFGNIDIRSAEKPIEISSIDFAVARFDAYKKACTALKPEDKRSRNLLGDFGIMLQRNLFKEKE